MLFPFVLLSFFLIGLIRLYQKFLSPLTSPTCRFHPTCSQYAIEAIEKYGFFKGIWKSLGRLIRCNPLCEGGFDPP